MASPQTFSSHLSALSAKDLEELLSRRPESMALTQVGAQTSFGDLARQLAAPEAIRAAIHGLNAFLFQLLEVTVWFGPQVAISSLADQTPGVDAKKLRAGLKELARWGLAFPSGTGKSALVHVPHCVMQEVHLPAGLGPHAAEVLENVPIAELIKMGDRIGIDWKSHPRKAHAIAAVSTQLSDQAIVRALLSQAPDNSRNAFKVIRSHGGYLSFQEAHELGLNVAALQPWARYYSESELEWLKERGLIAVISEWHLRRTGVMIVGEVELTLRDGLLHRDWSPDIPEFELAPLGFERADPGAILTDVTAVLDEWALNPPKRLQRGGVGVRDLKKTSKATGITEDRLDFVYALLAEAQLIEQSIDQVGPSSSAESFRQLPAPQAWDGLFRTWVESVTWDEIEGGLSGGGQSVRSLASAREAVIDLLSTVPPGRSAAAESFGQRLHWLRPRMFADPSGAERFAARVIGSLSALGTAHPGQFALLDPARTAYLDRHWHRKKSADAAFSRAVSECTVQADMHIIVAGPPVHDLGAALARFADVQQSSPARIYQLTERSLRSGLDAGMTGEGILEVLRKYSRNEIPQNVTYLVRDVAARHGSVVVGYAGLYVRGDDSSLLSQMVADRKLAKLGLRLLAPTVATTNMTDTPKLLEALRGAGYMPVEEDASGVRIAGPKLNRLNATPLVWRHAARPRPAPPSDEVVKELASRLAASGELAETAPAPRPPVAQTASSGVRKLLREAALEGVVVQIAYMSGSGAMTVREIEPHSVDATSVEGFCRLRQDDRFFMISRIRWARPTEATFSPVSGGDYAEA